MSTTKNNFIGKSAKEITMLAQFATTLADLNPLAAHAREMITRRTAAKGEGHWTVQGWRRAANAISERVAQLSTSQAMPVAATFVEPPKAAKRKAAAPAAAPFTPEQIAAIAEIVRAAVKS